MNDIELLTQAAKAAKLDVRPLPEWADGEWSGLIIYRDGELSQTNWNPLNDDGDAFRLAVQLGIHVWQYIKHQEVNCGVDHEDYEQPIVGISIGESFDNDPYAATRRAIVRAAAAIGGN